MIVTHWKKLSKITVITNAYHIFSEIRLANEKLTGSAKYFIKVNSKVKIKPKICVINTEL